MAILSSLQTATTHAGLYGTTKDSSHTRWTCPSCPATRSPSPHTLTVSAHCFSAPAHTQWKRVQTDRLTQQCLLTSPPVTSSTHVCTTHALAPMQATAGVCRSCGVVQAAFSYGMHYIKVVSKLLFKHPGAQSPPAGVILGHNVLLLVSSWGTTSSCWCHPEVEVPRPLCSLPRSSTHTDSDTNNIIICMLGGQTVHVCPHIAIDHPKFLYSPK